MKNEISHIQFHVVEVSPLDICLDLWACSMSLNDTDLGIQSQRSLKSNGDGYGNNDTSQSRRDNEIADATNAMIHSLATHHRWAIHKCKGICLVWNFPRLNYIKTLEDAKIQLEEKLRKNLATRTLF